MVDKNVSYHPKCGKLKINHLIFADDLMVFVKGDLPSVQKVKNSLTLFSQYSGLNAKAEKIEIYFRGVNFVVKNLILSKTGFVEGMFPFCYWVYLFIQLD